MKWMAQLLACSLFFFAYPMGASAERAAPNATWEYQFPPGIVDFSDMQVTPDIQYLAVSTGQWTYEASGSAGPATTEGENAVYVFDLRAKRLLWQKPFTSQAAVSVLGLLPSGSVVALHIGSSTASITAVAVQRRQGESVLKGTRTLGPPEAGMRIYDQAGRLLARGVPLERLRGTVSHLGRLLLRPVRKGETVPSDDVRRILSEAGIAVVSQFAVHGPYSFVGSPGEEHFATFAEDGTEKWRWALPPGENKLARAWRDLAVSPDLQYAFLSLTPYDGERPSDMRHLYLFDQSEGLLWEKQIRMPIANLPTESLSVLVANQASSALVVRTGPRAAAVDALDRSGAIKHSWEFGEMQPAAFSLSPDGHYWVAVLRQTWQGPTAADKGWSSGIHVFDCDTGEVVWSSPAMADAVYVMVTDVGCVVAASPATRTLAVFDPQT